MVKSNTQTSVGGVSKDTSKNGWDRTVYLDPLHAKYGLLKASGIWPVPLATLAPHLHVVADVPVETPNGSITVFTTTKKYKSGTLQVYVNGNRMTNDYRFRGFYFRELNTSQFQLSVAPQPGDLIIVDYVIDSSMLSQFYGMIPPETPDGMVDTFTVSSFQLLFKKVYVSGLRQKITLQYTETGDTIVFTPDYIPQANDVIMIDQTSQICSCSDHKYNVITVEQPGGGNRLFTLPDSYQPSSTRGFKSGMRLFNVTATTYAGLEYKEELPNKIRFFDAPRPGDVLMFDYEVLPT
jgi:hypothetical protein